MKRGLALVVVLALTACTAPPDTPGPTPSPSPTPTVLPLTVAQASKAALPVSGLPKGWDGGVAVDPRPVTEKSKTQFEPADCELVAGNPMAELGTPATAVRGQYFVREPSQSITELIYSWPTTQLPLVKRIADALPRCTKVTTISSVRTTARHTIKQVRIPGLKDGIALRTESVEADTPDYPFVSYEATVVRGGTVLQIFDYRGTSTTEAAFAQLLTKAVARLDAVS